MVQNSVSTVQIYNAQLSFLKYDKIFIKEIMGTEFIVMLI